jgi:hypothetical protein
MPFAALRAAAPGRAVELAVTLQRAFYVDGHALSTSDTYREIAERPSWHAATRPRDRRPGRPTPDCADRHCLTAYPTLPNPPYNRVAYVR